MKGRLVAVVVVAVLALVAAVVWFALRGGPEPVPAGPGPAPEIPAAEPGKPSPKPRERVRAGRTWVDLGAGEVAGVVREYGTEKALANVPVSLSAGLPGPDRTLETKTAADGTFRFREVPNFEDWALRVDAPAPLADVEQSAVNVVENKVTDLGVIYVTPGFSVPGIVVDELGQPLEGAEVRVLRPRGAGSQMDILRLIRELPVDTPAVDRATSGKDGKFVLTKTSPGSYDVKVVRAGRQVLVEKQVVVNPAAAARELRFVLSKGFSLDGKVVRKGPGSVAGLPVVAFRQPQGETDFLVLDRTYAVTDEEGKFHLDGLGGGRYVVAATPEGEPFALDDDVDIPSTTWLEIVIEGDAWLEGRITGRGGAPVPGAQVYVAGFRDKPTVGNTRTDADGRYVIRGLKSGPVDLLLVQAEGYATWPSDLMKMLQGGRGGAGIDLKPGRNEKDVSLEVGGTVRGVVLSKDDDSPLEGVRVDLVSVLAMFGGARSATTDAQGKFEITSVPLGATLLSLSKEGWFQPGLNPMSLAGVFMGREKQKDTGKGYTVSITEPGEVVERTLTLARGSTVVGQVLSPDGAPVPGARVQLRPEQEGMDFLGPISAMFGAGEPRLADSEGRFSIAGPTPGTKARVVATAPGFLEGRSDPLSAGIGEKVEGVRVSLRLGASIEGRVTDERGRPVESAMVRWLRTEGMNEWEVEWRMDNVQPSMTDADGRFRAANVEPGKVLVRVSHEKYLPHQAKDFVTEEGKAATLDTKLALGAVVDGRVLGTDGRPFQGAAVVFDPQQDEDAAPPGVRGDRDRRFTTDGEGRFVAEGLAPGRYDVRARAKGAAPSDVVSVVAGAQSGAITLRLQPALRIGGVVRAQGQPVARVRVTASRREATPGGPAVAAAGQDGARENWQQVASEQTDAAGKFVLEDLPAGNYRLEFRATDWGEERANILRKTVDDVAAGNEGLLVEVEPGLAIAGKVTLEDGTPAPQGWVNANQVVTDGKPLESPAHGWSQVVDGSFEIVGLPPGTYDVNVNVEGQGAKRVRVEAGTRDVKVVVGAGAKITGRVVKEDGTPATSCWVNARSDSGGQGATTDEEGRYTISGLEPGRYTVDAWPMGGWTTPHHGQVAGVDARANETVEAPTITMRPQKTGE